MFNKLLYAVAAGMLVATVWAVARLCTGPEKSAQRALDLGSSLIVGASGFEQVKSVGKKIGAQEKDGCSESHCVLVVEIENSHLLRWGHRSRVTFWEYFIVESGRLAIRSTGLRAGIGPASSTVNVEERLNPIKGDSTPLQLHARGEPSGSVTNIDVHLSPDVDDTIRMKYRSFNLGCLSKFGGCPSAERLLPGWK
jgi:hypothetical protein